MLISYSVQYFSSHLPPLIWIRNAVCDRFESGPLERGDARIPLDHAGQQSCSCWTKLLAAQVKVGSSQRHMEGVALECADAARRATEQGVADSKHTLISNDIIFDTASSGLRLLKSGGKYMLTLRVARVHVYVRQRLT